MTPSGIRFGRHQVVNIVVDLEFEGIEHPGDGVVGADGEDHVEDLLLVQF